MRLIACAGILCSATTVFAGVQPDEGFDRHFIDATLRVDFYHVGNATDELITFDRVHRQGVWAGTRSRLVDPFEYGGYCVKVHDAESGDLLFSRGFDSYFGEYRTTTEAVDGVRRTYHETVLVPFPRRPVRVSIEARRQPDSEVVIESTVVYPAALEVAMEPPARGAIVVDELVNGAPHGKLDLVIVGEGYTREEVELFHKDLHRFAGILFAHEPFASHRQHCNLRGVLKVSSDSGCDEPTRGSFRDTAIDATFNSLGSERYLLTEDNRELRDIAANVPYDALLIMVNHDRYGGGGIYNLFCTFTAHNQWSPYLLLHELGHSFGGLADEYYTSSVAYNDFYPRGVEPVEPNITALLDHETLKWKDLVSPGTQIPTPWEKDSYDAMDLAYQQEREALNEKIAAAARSAAPEAEISALKEVAEAHSKQHAEKARAYLDASAYAGQVGAFEGAGYSAEGLYRPMADCIMFTKGVRPFCHVCERAIAGMIELYTE